MKLLNSILLVLLTLQLFGSRVSAEDSVPNLKKPRPAEISRPFLIEFKGEIDWQSSSYLRAKIQQAKSSRADMIILDIESPGGLKSESLDLAEMMRDIDWAYTVAFVQKQALSGAALLTLGCDELIIGELANYGDIGIIQYDPQLFAFRFAPEKVYSMLILQARVLAESKGRSPELAEAMINKDFHVYQKETDGKLEFKGILKDDDAPGQPWELVSETKKGFLTVSGTRAKQLGLAQAFGSDHQAVADELGFDLSSARVIRHTTTDTVVYYLNHPFGTGVLILVGLIAFFLELSAPGIGFGGLVAGLCAALFFWSRFLGGTSTWLEIVLFLAGVTFLLMEVFVIPGWGVSGITGLFLTIASLFMASQDFVLPSTGRQWNQTLTTVFMMLCSGALFVIAAAFIVRNIGHIPIFSKLVLPPPEADQEQGYNEKPKPLDHPTVSVGDWGRADSLLRPAGRAVFAGRSYDVVSDGEYIDAGQQVKVIEISGNRIVVSGIMDEDLDETKGQ